MSEEPTNSVYVQHKRMVEMRDGTNLSTDLYLPPNPSTGDSMDDRVPALLLRTRYDKGARDMINDQGL